MITAQYSILLATYNGSRFIDDFLESCPWPKTADLIVSDDASTDDTIEKIEKFTLSHDISLTLLEGPKRGPKNNFAHLLAHVEKPYFFFADQDDTWEEHKIPTMLEAIQKLEKEYGKETPLLVYSDASLMNVEGVIFHDSFFKKSFVSPNWNQDFRNVLVMPFVAGCTMMGNKALAKAALPIPEEATMHDSWVLQVASALGHTYGIHKPLTRYRQHEANTLGANTLSWKNILQKIINNKKNKHDTIVETQRQAAVLLQNYGLHMSIKNYELCKAWSEAEYKSWLARRFVYAKYGFKKAGWLHNSILWIYG